MLPHPVMHYPMGLLIVQPSTQTNGIEYSKIPQKKYSLKSVTQYFQHDHVNNFHKP
jgi:hypothetical protein